MKEAAASLLNTLGLCSGEVHMSEKNVTLFRVYFIFNLLAFLFIPFHMAAIMALYAFI